MKNTFEVISTHTTCEDKFFTLAITNQEGDTHTDVWSEVLVVKAIRRGITLNVDMDNEEVVQALETLGYITVVEEDTFEGKSEFDVYTHKVTVDDVVSVDFAGDHLKTYKTEKAALNFAAKQLFPVM